MIKFSYDNGTVEPFTIVLSTRSMEHLGQISNIDEVNYTGNLDSANELSFKVYKQVDDHKEVLWDDIYDLRLVWIKELNEYFEITVELTDDVYMTKTITASSLCESELSQVHLFNIEINSEDDIARESYDVNYPTIFYRSLEGQVPGSEQYEKLRKSSLLHRILEKVPAYSIGTIDDSLAQLQRTFSVSDSTIYEFLTGECAEQFDCLFEFDSTSRTVSAHDLLSYCMNPKCPYYLNENNAYYTGSKHLRYRGEFQDYCPICNSRDYVHRYGTDTTIFVSTDNLTDEVQYNTNIDNVKNCFRLEAGDDDMTAYVININPNGSQYIYEFSDEAKRDMPTRLVELIDEYEAEYNRLNTTAQFYLNSDSVNKYNALCDIYNNDNIYKQGTDAWPKITLPIVGYTNLIPYYYKVVDFVSYLRSSMMPPVTIPEVTVEGEVQKIKEGLASQSIGISHTIKSTTTKSTVENAVISYAKILIKTGFVKIEVIDGTSSFDYETKLWKGNIRVTSVDDTDVYQDTGLLSVKITDDFDTFMREKIEKYLVKNTDDEYSISGILSKEGDALATELKKWCAKRLESFYDAVQAVEGILIEAGQGDSEADLYEFFYLTYHSKLDIIQKELDLRNSEIESIVGTDSDYSLICANSFDDGNIEKKRIFYYITKQLNEIREALNFENFVYAQTGSTDLYKVFTSYRREDTYSNSNFITDEDDDAVNFERAKEFMEKAKSELHKSATYQHSISSNLNNLLVIPEFKPIVDNFELGNWIRVKADETVYRLRLISYSINFGDIQTIDTEFSDVTVTADGLNDVASILNQAKSLSTSYGYIEKQSEVGIELQENYIDKWVEDGLNSSLVKISNNNDEDIVIDNTGITAKTRNDELESGIDPKQLRITHNVLAFTDDNWTSVKTALGQFDFKYHNPKITSDETIVSDEKYGLVAEAVMAGHIVGSHIESCDMISGHIQCIGNYAYIDLNDNTDSYEEKYFLKCGYKNSSGVVTDNFTVDKQGNIFSRSGRLEKDKTHFIDMSGNDDFVHLSDNFVIDKDGNVTMSGHLELGGINDNLGYITLYDDNHNWIGKLDTEGLDIRNIVYNGSSIKSYSEVIIEQAYKDLASIVFKVNGDGDDGVISPVNTSSGAGISISGSLINMDGYTSINITSKTVEIGEEKKGTLNLYGKYINIGNDYSKVYLNPDTTFWNGSQYYSGVLTIDGMELNFNNGLLVDVN